MQIHSALVAHQRLEPLDGVTLDADTHALANHAIEVDEHTEPEEIVHLVLVRRETPHQTAYRLLARPVEGGQLVDGCRLVVVVVEHVQTRVLPTSHRDEVDQLLESALFAGTIEHSR